MRLITLLHNGLAGALVTGGAVLVVLLFVGGLGGASLPLPLAILLVLAGAAVGGAIQGALVHTGGTIATAIVQPSGRTTPYTPTFSHIQAIEVRGDLEGAARAWAEACAEHPVNARVWVKAADFHLRTLDDAAAALPLYQYVRDLEGAPSELVRYASQKIVDVYLGPLGDEGRALVELRRLIERYPGTVAADEARAALTRLKDARAQR
ncbi:MAG: hypothetical protein OEW77_06170 [Gemmatimonadota bacterium]|nr:hypothetical protein [Gemmatimonadota bacterium]